MNKLKIGRLAGLLIKLLFFPLSMEFYDVIEHSSFIIGGVHSHLNYIVHHLKSRLKSLFLLNMPYDGEPPRKMGRLDSSDHPIDRDAEIPANDSFPIDNRMNVPSNDPDLLEIVGNDDVMEGGRIMDTQIGDFEVVSTMPGYIDKTMLIKSVINDTSGILLVAPRRFGKSVNLTMLKNFFEMSDDPNVIEKNRKLFVNTSIYKEKPRSTFDAHFAKFPVLYLDFRPKFNVTSYKDAFDAVRRAVHTAYCKHPYLGKSETIFSEYMDEEAREKRRTYVKNWMDPQCYKEMANDENNIGVALESLANFLTMHYRVPKIVVLVDEYDGICAEAMMHVRDDKNNCALEQIRRINKFCMGCIESVGKGNKRIARIILTGISVIATSGMSGLNNIEVRAFQQSGRYSKCPYYGITRDELKNLLEKKVANTTLELTDIIEYYNGFWGGVMSIASVMMCLNNDELKSYWEESQVVFELGKALSISEVRSIINHLLSDFTNEYTINRISKIDFDFVVSLINVIEARDIRCADVNVFLNFLLDRGYFGLSGKNCNKNEVKISIPNMEIRDQFVKKLLLHYEKAYGISTSSIKKCASIFDMLSTTNTDNVEKLRELQTVMNEIMLKATFQVINEATFHHIVFLIIYHSKFMCFSEVRSSTKDRKILDLLMVRGELGVILELRVQRDVKYTNEYYAETGLKQILDNKYYQAFDHEDYKSKNGGIAVTYYLLIGCAMSKEQEVALSVLVNNMDFNVKIPFPNPNDDGTNDDGSNDDGTNDDETAD